MTNKSNVINFADYKKRNGAKAKGEAASSANKVELLKGLSSAPPQVINLEVRRQEEIEIDRRSVTRTVLSQFIGVFVVMPNKSLQPVAIHDVSEGGLAFDIPAEVGTYNIGESVTMRIYLSHDTYFSFSVKVANHRGSQADGVMRHGTIFRKNDESFKTLFYFTKFLENVSVVAKTDSGERVVGRVD